MTVSRALLSVSDKTGLAELGRALTELGVELLASSGTAAALEAAGCPVVRTETLTGFAELLDGRVKTLHPAIHAGILARREDDSHMRQLAAADFPPLDLVVVNLYPFVATAGRAGVTLPEAIEQIDIGGVALIRSAAKNHAGVAVLTDPADYGVVAAELKSGGRALSPATREALAVKAFAATAAYDAAIAGFLGARLRADRFPDPLVLAWRKKQGLRYGENPHQAAAVYEAEPAVPGSLAAATQLSGKEISHNNYLDFDSALAIVREFDEPCCAVIKHRNACGCAAGGTLASALERAVRADALSAFGGMVAVNRTIDAAAARAILELLQEVKKFDGLVAPAIEPDALELLRGKPAPFPGKNMVILATGPRAAGTPRLALRSVDGGLLVQEPDAHVLAPADLKVATKRAPTPAEERDLLFAWKVCKHIVSNAIVLAKDGCTVGIGAGQVNRVGSVGIAARQAGTKARGAAMASDAFFPYPDGVEEAVRAGVTAAIQPGGSMKDPDVIATADAAGMAMILTGIRHFKH